MRKIKNIVSVAVVSVLASVASAQGVLAVDDPTTPWGVGKANAENTGLPSGSIYAIIGQIMTWLLGILGFIAIIGFVISGILYLTAAGDEGRIETAKTAMVYSIVGVLVALVGFVIVQAVESMLGGTSSQF